MNFLDKAEKNVDRLMKEESGGSVAGFTGRAGRGIDALFSGPYHPDSGHGSQNKKLLAELKSYINLYKEFNFFLRDHPRFNHEVILDDIYSNDNVFSAPNSLHNCFNKCSIHLTAYSTITFESAMYGIPTIFLSSLDDIFNMFSSDFYLDKKKDLLYTFNHYEKESSFFKKWVVGFYDNYDEKRFISILR